MTLCFGTFAKILLLCGIDKLTKTKLLNRIVKSVDRDCTLSDNAVTNLITCRTNLPDKRANSLGEVISKALAADPKKVSDYFTDKVIPLINPNKRKLAVLALCDLIANDEEIKGDIVIEPQSQMTKNPLKIQSKFYFSDFLAGIFLFTAGINNHLGAKTLPLITKEYLDSFEEHSSTIDFLTHKKTDDNTAYQDAFIAYLQSAENKYNSVKTLLYNNEPKPFYSFYVPNELERAITRNNIITLSNVNVEVIKNISNFVIIQGTGGLGKSMMMRHLLLDAIQNTAKLHLIPVLIQLKDYADCQRTSEKS
jgi:hypothetical protein